MKQKKHKILHTIRQGKIGGGETHVLDLVGSLHPDYFHSEVLTFTDGEMVNRLHALNVPCTVIHTEKPFDVTVWGKVKKFMQERQFDLVHAHGTRACSNSFKSANDLNLPLAYTIHGWSFHPDQSFFLRTAREKSERFLVRRTSCNISVSQSNNRDGMERLGMPNSRVINYGINLEKFAPEKEYPLSRKDLNWPEDKFLMGMVARLTKQKDPATFIKAFAKVSEQRPEAHAVIVGGGELEPQCKELAQQYGLEERLTFEPFRTDVPAVLKLLDVYCLPSLWEGLPIGILEAMAMQKTIVATPVDGTKEVITDGETGYLFPEYDHEAMAQKLIQCIDNRERGRQLGLNAHKRIEQDFTVPLTAKNVGNLYLELLGDEQRV